MITNAKEYAKTGEQLRYMEAWLARLLEAHPGADQGLTKAGVRHMIARLHEEMAQYEGELQFEDATALAETQSNT